MSRSASQFLHMRRWMLRLLGSLVVVAVFAIPAAAAADSPLKVVVTIAPLKGLVEPLLPPGSTVHVLMKPGRSEHGYEFSPADLSEIARADIVAYVGLNLEPRIEAALARPGLPHRRAICFADVVGLALPKGDEHGGDGHGHGDTPTAGEGAQGEPEGHVHDEHCDHGPIDQHLWLDPVLVEKFITAAAVAIAQAHPETDATRLDQARDDLVRRVRDVDSRWKEALKPLAGRTIVTHHNAFSRPAERYGFVVAEVIRQAEGAEPTPGDVAKVIEAVRARGVKAIFVEPQFNPAAAKRIAEASGVRLGMLDPLGDGDWFKLMDANLDSLVTNLAD